MFGLYALPSDDAAVGATVVASAEDPDYLAENLVSATPSRPAKLTTTTGSFDLTLTSSQTIVAAALIYHNLDAGLADVELTFGAGSPADAETFVIPAHHADGWPVSPWMEFSPRTTDTIQLSFGTANSLAITVGRLLLLTALRQTDSDVRWGVEETEEYGLIEQRTALGVETIYNLGGKRRLFAGEFPLYDATAQEIINLHRSAAGRVLPWLLIPDENVNDAWLVRFLENRWARVRESPNFNVMPFRVQELSRGLPWP